MRGLAATIGRHTTMLLVTALMAAPLVWVVGASLKSEAEFDESPFTLWPQTPRPENYAEALTGMPFGRYLANTLVLCTGTVAGMLLSCSLAAYALGVMRWPGRDAAFTLVVAGVLLPWQATMIPRFVLLREAGFYNSMAALIVPAFLGDAFSIFLLRQFFRSLPRDLISAARIDGCGHWGVYWRVVLPLSRPALVTVGLLQFVAAWNDYGGPLLYLSDPEKFPLAYGLERFVSANSSQTPQLLAAALVFSAPLVAVFLVAQRAFIRGVATTGIKG